MLPTKKNENASKAAREDLKYASKLLSCTECFRNSEHTRIGQNHAASDMIENQNMLFISVSIIILENHDDSGGFSFASVLWIRTPKRAPYPVELYNTIHKFTGSVESLLTCRLVIS